jgi:hypothetical protein
MNKRIILLFAVPFFLIAIIGCQIFGFGISQKRGVYWSGNTSFIDSCKKVVVLQVVLEPPIVPSTNRLTDEIYLSNQDEIVPEIFEAQQEYVVDIEKYLGETLKEVCNCEVIYGQRLYNSREYISLKYEVTIYKKLYNHIDFPEVFMTPNAYNFFNFHGAGHILLFFNNEELVEHYKPKLKFIADKLGASQLLISISAIRVTDFNFIIDYGIRIHDTKLFFFNDEGELAAYANAISPSTEVAGDNYEDYLYHLDEYEENIYLIFNKLDSTYINKELDSLIKHKDDL